jgi:hypothetical protein
MERVGSISWLALGGKYFHQESHVSLWGCHTLFCLEMGFLQLWLLTTCLLFITHR